MLLAIMVSQLFFVLNKCYLTVNNYSIAINRANTQDSEMDAIMDSIVDSLFSVFVTLGTVPIIRCPKNTAAEMVGKRLNKKIRENLWDARNNLFHMDATQTGAFSFQRPVLIILDRNIDMATPLHHTWTYQALTHDILDLSLNRVVIPDDEGPSTSTGAKSKMSKTKPCDLDSNDRFWMSHKGSPFPLVAESIQEELESYRTSEDEIKKLKTSMGMDGESDVAYSMVNDTTARLTNAINSLPQLMEKKRLIDQHTKIATSILNFIKSRRLDSYFEMEEKIMSKSNIDRSPEELLRDPEFGTPEDKMRLFIIYYICTSIPESEFSRYEAILQEAGCDLTPLPYIQRWKSIMKGTSSTIPNQYEGGGTKTVNMFSKLVSQGSSFVMEGVKNLVVKRHNLPVTKITEQLMECRVGAETDDYLYLDPKILKSSDHAPKNRTPFQDSIVFIIGGGNYIEYQNLVDYIKQKQTSNATKRIIYGASTLTNAKQFLKQIALLGQEITDLK